VYSLAHAANAKLFAAGGSDGVARLLDPDTGAVVRTIDVGASIDALALSPDGNTLATGGPSATGTAPVQLWDTRTGALVRTLAGHPGQITSLQYSADGWYLVSTSAGGSGAHGSPSGDARLWLSQTGELVATAVAQPGAGFVSAAFAPDAHTLALGATDQSVRLWTTR
jgi:WD40 repeat protein